jgi:acylphosphatase
MLLTVSILVTGKVQGVYYRQTAKEKALALGIKGKVMNLPDGNVQIIATGTKDQIDMLLQWCKEGPPKAVVSNVSFLEIPLQEFSHFIIARF